MKSINVAGQDCPILKDDNGFYTRYTVDNNVPENWGEFQQQVLGYDDDGKGLFPYCKNQGDLIKLLFALVLYDHPYEYNIDYSLQKKLSRCSSLLLRKIGKSDNFIKDSEYSYLIGSEESTNIIKVLDKNRYIKSVKKDLYNNSNQYNLKIGRFLKSVFPKASSSQIEEAVNEWVALNCPAEFREVDGEDIATWYHEDSYNTDENTGSLSGSCMKYSNCSDFFGIYTDNPDKVKLIILVECGLLIGRALLWTMRDGTMLMDRIYANDSNIEKFKMYARSKGYAYKEFQSYDRKKILRLPSDNYSEKHTCRFSIELEGDFDYYPYIDTFTYSSGSNKGVKTFFNYENDSYNYCYTGTEGGRSKHDSNPSTKINLDGEVFI